MNRIDNKFENLKKSGKKALITFITAGDPDFDTTEKLVLEMEKSGADIIELGVPFSDPVAEGIVIQEASLRALNNGTTLIKIFELVKKLRTKTDIPLLLMMYINCIFRFGTERFFSLCSENGIDGVIVPDLPYEEKHEISDIAESFGIHSISIVAPTSKDRIKMIANDAKGFLYCVSSTGVTGMRNSFTTDFEAFSDTIKKESKIPNAIGFGISTPEQAYKMKEYCDGIIVGSAIVKIVAEHGNNSPEHVGKFVRELRASAN
jgi:tryptophan synthase alpha chain